MLKPFFGTPRQSVTNHEAIDLHAISLTDFVRSHEDVRLLIDPGDDIETTLRAMDGIQEMEPHRYMVIVYNVADARRARDIRRNLPVALRASTTQFTDASLRSARDLGICAILVTPDIARDAIQQIKACGMQAIFGTDGEDDLKTLRSALDWGAAAVVTRSITPERLKRSYEVMLSALAPYEDSRGNRIIYEGARSPKTVAIRIRGRNNTLVVHRDSRISLLRAIFDNDNATVEIGPTRAGIPQLAVSMRAGQDATIRIGRDVTTTQRVFISAVEGASVIIGDDVMFASENEVRADDAHAIYDVETGLRVNPSRSIQIGNHVWLAREAVVLGGVTIGDGTVVGYRSLVTRSLPNNCVAAGIPAKVIRRNAAWERMHLDDYPPYKPSASVVPKSSFWSRTND